MRSTRAEIVLFARAFQCAPRMTDRETNTCRNSIYCPFRHYNFSAGGSHWNSRVNNPHVADRLEYSRVHYISAYIIRGELERAREPSISAHALSILKQVFQCMRGVMERAHKQFISAHARNMLTL